MGVKQRLEKLFLLAIIIPLVYIIYSWYQSNSFKNNPLALRTQQAIKHRQNEVLMLIRQKYGVSLDNIPLIVSDEFSSQLYGLTGYKNERIVIYLNKKRFRESERYMIEEVIPHEYAHALMFVLKQKSSHDGHTQLWQQICLALDGKECIRYVDNEEIIAQKMMF